MSTILKLDVANKSTQSGSFAIYQNNPNVDDPNILALAWLSKRVHLHTDVLFEWTTDLCFVWGETPKAGEPLYVAQTVPASVNANNAITYTVESGAGMFEEPFTSESVGDNLLIKTAPTVGATDSMIGIGMSGKPTFVVPAAPNMDYVFNPTPQYFLLFTEVIEGEIMTAAMIDGAAKTSQPFEIKFDGTTEVSVVFNADNTWSISA
jgi:hypothetical protein